MVRTCGPFSIAAGRHSGSSELQLEALKAVLRAPPDQWLPLLRTAVESQPGLLEPLPHPEAYLDARIAGSSKRLGEQAAQGDPGAAATRLAQLAGSLVFLPAQEVQVLEVERLPVAPAPHSPQALVGRPLAFPTSPGAWGRK